MVTCEMEEPVLVSPFLAVHNWESQQDHKRDVCVHKFYHTNTDLYVRFYHLAAAICLCAQVLSY